MQGFQKLATDEADHAGGKSGVALSDQEDLKLGEGVGLSHFSFCSPGVPSKERI